MIGFCIIQSFVTTLFIAAVFMLRDIKDEFNIYVELRRVTMLRWFTNVTYLGFLIFFNDTWFVVLGGVEYI